MKYVFLMDPLETVNIDKDTSFILMLGAYRKGHDIYYLPDGGITQKDSKLVFHLQKVIPQKVKDNPFVLQEKIDLKEDQIDTVFIRTDPPFDYKYLMHTWLLDRLSKRIPVVNNPAGIRTVNEKIWATQFTSLIPPTLIGRDKKDLLEFISEHNTVIVKPTDGYGGQLIFHIEKDDLNTNVILETVTKNYSQDVIMQKYVAQAAQGDKRIILLNGEPLGAVLRVHSKDDHRNNFFAGGKAHAAQITPRDQEIIDILKPHLKELGLYFVGIDVLGDYLIEVNVTSPTCLQEISHFSKQPLENTVIEFIEKLVEERKSQVKIGC